MQQSRSGTDACLRRARAVLQATVLARQRWLARRCGRRSLGSDTTEIEHAAACCMPCFLQSFRHTHKLEEGLQSIWDW